jgi:hypothetical protein
MKKNKKYDKSISKRIIFVKYIGVSTANRVIKNYIREVMTLGELRIKQYEYAMNNKVTLNKIMSEYVWLNQISKPIVRIRRKNVKVIN